MPSPEKANLDSIFETIDPTISIDDKGDEKGRVVAFWIPLDYKLKYDLLQGRTKQRFGKKLKELVIKSIDRMDIEAL